MKTSHMVERDRSNYVDAFSKTFEVYEVIHSETYIPLSFTSPIIRRPQTVKCCTVEEPRLTAGHFTSLNINSSQL